MDAQLGPLPDRFKIAIAMEKGSVVSHRNSGDQAIRELPRRFAIAPTQAIDRGGAFVVVETLHREMIEPQKESLQLTGSRFGPPPNRTWAELMRRGLDIDVLECPGCGGRLRFISAILGTAAIVRILEHVGLPSEPVRFLAARAPPHPDELWAS